MRCAVWSGRRRCTLGQGASAGRCTRTERIRDIAVGRPTPRKTGARGGDLACSGRPYLRPFAGRARGAERTADAGAGVEAQRRGRARRGRSRQAAGSRPARRRPARAAGAVCGRVHQADGQGRPWQAGVETQGGGGTQERQEAEQLSRPGTSPKSVCVVRSQVAAASAPCNILGTQDVNSLILERLAWLPHKRLAWLPRATTPIKTGKMGHHTQTAWLPRATTPVKTGKMGHHTQTAWLPRATTPIKTGKMGHHTQTPTCGTPDGTLSWYISSTLWAFLSLLINVSLIHILLP